MQMLRVLLLLRNVIICLCLCGTLLKQTEGFPLEHIFHKSIWIDWIVPMNVFKPVPKYRKSIYTVRVTNEHQPRQLSYRRYLIRNCLYRVGADRRECVANLVRRLRPEAFRSESVWLNDTVDAVADNTTVAPENGKRRGRPTYAGSDYRSEVNPDSLICRKREFGFPDDVTARIVDMATDMLCALCRLQRDFECVERWCYIDTG